MKGLAEATSSNSEVKPGAGVKIQTVEITLRHYQSLENDSRMLKQLIAAGAKRLKVWKKASELLRLDFGG